MAFIFKHWYRDFLYWMRNGRGHEVIDILSDFSNEQYLNGLTAMHLRHYGKRLGIPGWWARGEWDKVDIRYGAAKDNFDNCNRARSKEITGEVGQMEVKVLYWHYQNSKHEEYLRTLYSQLSERQSSDKKRCEGRDLECHGLVWLLVFEPLDLSQEYGFKGSTREEYRDFVSSSEQWHDAMAQKGHKLVASADMAVDRRTGACFDQVARRDIHDLWPLDGAPTASLWLTCVELAG